MSQIVRKAQNGGIYVEVSDNDDTIPVMPVDVPITVGASLMYDGVVYKVISVEDNGMEP